jgi:hypothetical protein
MKHLAPRKSCNFNDIASANAELWNVQSRSSEMYLGTANSPPDELVVARGKARERRVAVNRAVSCHRCAPATGPAAACNPP